MNADIRWERQTQAIKSRRPDETMRFGLAWPYAPTTLPSTAFSGGSDPLDVQLHIELAMAAEAAGFDFGFIADGYAPDSDEASSVHYRDSWLSASLWALPLFMATRTMGVITTLHTTYLHPTHIARIGAQLDWISQGRWGWNVVTGYREEEAQLFGLATLPDHDARYDQAEESVEIVEGLWRTRQDSFTFQGRYYECHGRLAGPFPVQDKPLRIQAGVSERGKNFAAARCDYLLAPLKEFSAYKQVAHDMETRGEAVGRKGPPCVPLLPWLFHVRDEPGRAAEELAEFAKTIYHPALDAGMKHLEKGSQSGGGFSNTVAKRDETIGLVGTVEEVAEQLIVANREHGVRGMVAALLFWGPEAALNMGKVFARLQQAGVWQPPQQRDNSW